MGIPLLDGFTVGITADRRWEEQAELLRRRGATIMHGPCIRTLPIASEDALQEATDNVIMNPPDILIANTGIGMRSWFAAAESWGVGEALYGALRECVIFARGPKASAVVHQAGLPVQERAASERLSEVVTLALQHGVKGKTIAFQRHGEDAPSLIADLEEAGAILLEIPVYSWKIPTDLKPAQRLIEAIIQQKVQAITFTSAPAIRNMFTIAEELDLADELHIALNTHVTTVCVGPVCSGVAIEQGIDNPVVPAKARLGPMIRDLAEALTHAQQPTTLADGNTILLQGTSLIVNDNHRYSLPEREVSLVTFLLQRKGAIVSKAELLGTIWGEENDEHVVEVTVGRLRKRIEVPIEIIISVPRRGYRLAL
jgi:uroporphyrinogen-III synthase